MSRKKIIAGNWKMNADKSAAISLVKGIISGYNEFELSETKIVLVSPPFPYIHFCSSEFSKFPFLYAAAQNCSEHEKGAYTGEVSANIIASLDVKYVIVGHSERREYFNESNAQLLKKVQQVLQHNLIPIFCCGETLEIREQNKYFSFLKSQLEECIFHLPANEFKKLVIAYEPVWAIGTGKTASKEEAQEVHAFIRNEIENKYDKHIAENCSILYGGSVNAKNAAGLFSCQDIDGGLVGGASLKLEEFISIIKAMNV